MQASKQVHPGDQPKWTYTLYTTLSHDDLIKVLNGIVDFVFEGGSKTYIGVSSCKAFWMRKQNEKTYFTKSSLKVAIKHLIVDSDFHVGNVQATYSDNWYSYGYRPCALLGKSVPVQVWVRDCW